MAQEVRLGRSGSGKSRSFGTGLFLAIITLGVYFYFWYYFVNDELKDIGIAHDDRKLADSSPAMSLVAVLIGGVIIVPPLLSVYNYGQRIKSAQILGGVPTAEQISPLVAFWTAFFGFLIVPALYHYWYVTNHQNLALSANGSPV